MNAIPGNSLRRPPTKAFLLSAAIVLMSIAAYLPAISAGYIWDDKWLVIDNPQMRSSEGLWQIWTDPLFRIQVYQKEDAIDYYPVTWTAFWLEYHLWGPNFAAGYHATNVLLHAAGAVLVYFALRRLAVPGAFLAAVIFAVHPVNVASVAWISEQKNTLSFIFYLLSILFFLKHDGGGGRKWSWYGLSLGMFALGLLSKTSVIMLPVVLLLLAWWKRDRIARRDFLKTVPFFALSLLAALMSLRTQSNPALHALIRGTDENPIVRLIVAGMTPWFYLYKILLPTKLAMIYPSWTIEPASFISYLPLAALVGVFVLLWLFRTGWRRPILFAFAYFIITLLPVMGFFTMAYYLYSYVADHWLYIPIISIIALVVAGGCRLGHRVWPIIPRLAAAIVVVVLFALTWQQASTYKDQETLWRDNVEKYPDSWMANVKYAQALEEKYPPNVPIRHYQDEALRFYQHAIRFHPKIDTPYLKTCTILIQQGRPQEASEFYRKGIEANPRSVMIFSDYGAFLHSLGRDNEALTNIQKAIELDPNCYLGHANMTVILSGMGKFDQAMPHALKALELHPEDILPNMLYAKLLAQEGKLTEAIDAFRKVLKLQPDNMEALNILVGLYMRTNQPQEAITAMENVLERQNDNVQLRMNLARLSSQTGDVRRAITNFRYVVEHGGDQLEALVNLAFLLASAGEDDMRDGREALHLAEMARRIAPDSPEVLDALAAAYAETGDFKQAAAVAAKAVTLAEAAGDAKLAEGINARLALYKSGKPYRLPPKK